MMADVITFKQFSMDCYVSIPKYLPVYRQGQDCYYYEAIYKDNPSLLQRMGPLSYITELI